MSLVSSMCQMSWEFAPELLTSLSQWDPAGMTLRSGLSNNKHRERLRNSAGNDSLEHLGKKEVSLASKAIVIHSYPLFLFIYNKLSQWEKQIRNDFQYFPKAYYEE